MGAELPLSTRPSATRPSYYTRGALKTRGGCRASMDHASIAHASIVHASILLDAWSPKNGAWVQSIHRPRVDPSCGRADPCMCGCVHAWTRQQPFFFWINHANSPKLYRSYDPHFDNTLPLLKDVIERKKCSFNLFKCVKTKTLTG